MPRPRSRSRTLLFAALALLASAPAALAGSYTVVDGDRNAFDALIAGGATVVDSHGSFAPDPAAATGQASLLRSGTIAGAAYAYEAFDVDFSAAPTGFLNVGSVGGDVFDLDLVDVETPAAQSGGTGLGSFGLDSGSGSSSTRNALLVHFGVTPGGLGIGHFGVDLIDFEASSLFTTGELRLYDAGVLVFSAPIDFGAGAGNDTSRFFGVVADPSSGGLLFDTVAFVLGDDSAGDGRFERWAADRFTFGQGVLAVSGQGGGGGGGGGGVVATPEPSSWALLGVGLAGLAVRLGRRRRHLQTRRARRTNTSSATQS